MSLLEFFFIGVALSMDAFAVSISDGLTMRSVSVKRALAIALTFGGFQFLMPVLGYVCASFFYRFISAVDHWIAFALLAVLGGKMTAEALKAIAARHHSADGSRGAVDESGTPAGESGASGSDAGDFLSLRALMVQGVATSIDALAVGISFAAMPALRATYAQTLLASAVCPALLIGATTASLCLPAVFIGKKTGEKLGDKAELLGGVILVAIGIKILIEHVFFGA